MEVAFVNSDYEEVLYSDNPTLISSNKKNQQFEFFAWLLDYDTIYSTRQYKEDYLLFLEKLTGKKKKTTTKNEDLTLFWGKTSPLHEMQKLNSKITSTRFALEKKLCPKETRFMKAPFELLEDEIAKRPFSFSGRGHLTGPRTVKEEGEYILEKKYKRLMDFSALCFKDKTLFYKNRVDEKFQYKGTLISRESETPSFLSPKFQRKYLEDIACIREEFDQGLALEESYSVDSFLYFDEKNKEEKLYSLCEINFRTTMGKMAYKLSKEYLPSYAYHFLGITSKKRSERMSEKHLYLSPDDNFFHVVLLGADSEEELLSQLPAFYCD